MTEFLTPGDYMLLVGAWENYSTKIVGLNQTTVTVLSPPVADAGGPYSGARAATPLSDVGVEALANVNEPLMVEPLLDARAHHPRINQLRPLLNYQASHNSFLFHY